MEVHIDKQGRRIIVKSRGRLSGMKTGIPGAYLTAGGYWTVPLTFETCLLLRAKFGNRLRIGKELNRWARGVKNTRTQMKEIGDATDATLELLDEVAPRLAEAMNARTYQRAGVRFIAETHAALIAHDPGLGKTLIALGGILESGTEGPYLIVCPRTASDSVWRREIKRWLPKDHRVVIMPDFRYQRERALKLTRYGPKTWIVINPEMLNTTAHYVCNAVLHRDEETGVETLCGKRTPVKGRQQSILLCEHPKPPRTKPVIGHKFPRLFEIEWGCIIADESHESLIIRGVTPTQRRRGFAMLRVRRDGKRIAISGTPFDSKPHQLFGTLNWLEPRLYTAFHRWAETFWERGGFTGHEIGELRPDREKMLWDSLAPIALRKTKAEVAADLPPKAYVGTPLDDDDPDSPVGVWLEMDGKQADAYEQMEKLSVVELESGQLDAPWALQELMRLKQFATTYGDVKEVMKWVTVRDKFGDIVSREWLPVQQFVPQLPSNKYDWTVENLEEWGFPYDQHSKVVIVSNFTRVLELFGASLEKHFKTKPSRPLCTAITGRTPNKDRRAIIDKFNQRDKNTPQIMLLNLRAGGTAITIDTADRMIFLSESSRPDKELQAEDRIHRISNPRTCLYYYLRSIGTVDVGTAIANVELQHETQRLLDGRRGVAYMRRIIELSH